MEMGQIDFSSSGKYDTDQFVEKLIPLSIFVDSDFTVTKVSSAMNKAVKNLNIGSDLEDVFKVLRPKSFDDLRLLDDSSYFIQLEDVETGNVFKSMKLNGSDGHFILACNPIINADYTPAHYNLTVSDFSTHDVMAEYAFLLKANKIGLREGSEVLDKQTSLLKEIRNAQEFYEKILNSIPIDIAVFDKHHKYKFVNTTAVSDSDLRKSIIGKDDFEYFKELGRSSEIPKLRRERFKKVVNTESVVEWKQEYLNKKGSNDTILRRLSPVYNKTGEIDLVIGYGMDITKQVEKDFKIESLSRFPNENPNPVMRLSTEGVILFANDSAMENFLMPHNLKLGDTIAEDYSFLMNLDGAKSNRVERVLKFNNKTFSVLYIKVPGKEYVNVYASDITSSKTEIEKREKNLKKEIAHSSELIKNLETVNKFSMLIQESQTLEDVVWSVCENAIRHLGYEDCVIYLLDEDNPDYLYQAAALGNKNPDERIILGPIKIKIGEGIVGSVALSGRSELISDTSKDKRYLTDDVLRLSEITVPIINNNKVIGVIDSEHSQKHFFPENHLRILNTISAMTATKIVQVKYNEELINHKNRLEETVQKRTNDLIEVEKLAVLGRLSAGVAHEMNTPLGAIASSSDNLTGILRELFADGMENANHNTLIEACKLADDLMANDTLTSREERQERKLLAEHLKYEYNVGSVASNHATSLVECGILRKHKDALDHIYQSDDVEAALELTLVIMRIRKSIDTIGLASQKAATVVRALKSYVHNDNVSSVEVFDVRRSVQDVLLLFNNQMKKNVELHIDMESELLMQGNESELSKVWSNLIANALYAMENNGNLWVVGATNRHNIVLTFTNDGPVIPDEVKSRLFEPFYTTKPVGEGSGMGLSIAFNVVASMGGSIEVKTGAETTFTVTIPKTKR